MEMEMEMEMECETGGMKGAVEISSCERVAFAKMKVS